MLQNHLCRVDEASITLDNRHIHEHIRIMVPGIVTTLELRCYSVYLNGFDVSNLGCHPPMIPSDFG